MTVYNSISSPFDAMQIAQALIDASMIGENVDVDNADLHPIGSNTTAEFEMTKWIEKDDPKGSSRGHRRSWPIGQVIYTVTVKAEFVTFDENE